jgi:hypothetical protein
MLTFVDDFDAMSYGTFDEERRSYPALQTAAMLDDFAALAGITRSHSDRYLSA